MRIFKNIIIGLFVLILMVIIASYFFVQNISNKALPDYNQNINISGLTDQVEVFRDAYAIPHVYAKTEDDLYRAVGYLMAQDRLWQMDLMRRATTGRLSEIFGKDMIQADQVLRSLRISEKSQKVLAQADTKIVNALEAFSAGVNQFLDENMDNLPPEFTILGYQPEKWKPLYSVNLVGYMAWDLKMGWNQEILLYKLADKVNDVMLHELIPDLDKQKTYVVPDYKSRQKQELLSNMLDNCQPLKDLGLEVFNASNNWAVSGSKSTTGKPIFANDMHLGLFAPGIWYQMHQNVDGKLNVTGVMLPGAPFIICGHNDSIAWGMTNVMLDDVDFYEETINPDNPNEYRLDGQWKKMEIRVEKIKLKDGKTIEKEQKYTHRGPIVSEFKGITDKAISFKWVGNEFSNELRTVYLLNRAGNWSDFRDAVKTFISVSQNIAYADVYGNIGLQTSAGIPIRAGSGIAINPGDTSLYDWKGIVPFEELPYSFNPESGYVSSANNNTVDSTFGHYVSQWFYPPYRIDRIREMLQEKEKLSVDDFKRMHLDQKSKLVEKMLGNLLEVLGKAKLKNREEKALAYLKDWDMVLSTNSQAASIFESFYLQLVKNTLQDEMGKELFKAYNAEKLFVMNGIENIWINDSSEWYDDVNTKKKESRTDIVIRSFKDAVKELDKLMGNNVDEWQWGNIHQLILKHPMGKVKLLDKIFELNSPAYPVGGSFHTVSPWSYPFNEPFTVNYGPSHRHIYNTANWDESQTIIPTGISGIPASEHYCDQTSMYVAGQYHSDFISLDKIKETAKYSMLFTKE